MSSLATAADCADTLLVARMVRNWAVGALLIMLVSQLALFGVLQYSRGSRHASSGAQPSGNIAPAATMPAEANSLAPTTLPAVQEPLTVASGQFRDKLLQYALGLTSFLALILCGLLCVDLLLIINVMVIARLLGLGRVTRAFFWSVVLSLLLFPWQAFLNNQGLTGQEFKIPGVLYTWNELQTRLPLHYHGLAAALLDWTRFVAAPVGCMILLLLIHRHSTRGLRLALGLDQPPTPLDALPPNGGLT